MQINGYEVPLTEPEYLAVFDRISMVEHNCRANCNKSFTSDGQIVSYHNHVQNIFSVSFSVNSELAKGV